MGSWELIYHFSLLVYLFVENKFVLRHKLISLANIIQAPISGNIFLQTCHLITKITLWHKLHHELSLNSHK